MQVSVENTGPLERKLRIEIPEDRIASEVQNRLQSLSKTTKVQGFRPGKVPFKVVEKRFGSRVRQEVIGEVLQSSFYEALAKEKLQPASRPTIDPMDAEQGQGLKFTATFEIYPEIDLAPVEKLKIEKLVCQISDEDVEKMIEVIRKQHQQLKPVDRKAKNGDFLTVDFKGTIGGEAFEGGEASDFKIELGSKRFITGFEEGLVGAKSGDQLTLNLVFPDDYHNKALSGKPVVFEVSVKEVREPELPELNDELFSIMGIKEGGIDAFIAEVRRNMESEVEQAVLNSTKSHVLDALYSANKVELPKNLVTTEAGRLREQFQSRLQMQGINMDHQQDTEAEVKAFTAQAQKKVTLQLIMTDIVKKQQIKADPTQVRTMIENVARSYDDPNEVINWYYGDSNRLAEVEALALEDEVVKWVLSKADVSDKQLSFDDLMNKRQTETI